MPTRRTRTELIGLIWKTHFVTRIKLVGIKLAVFLEYLMAMGANKLLNIVVKCSQQNSEKKYPKILRIYIYHQRMFLEKLIPKFKCQTLIIVDQLQLLLSSGERLIIMFYMWPIQAILEQSFRKMDKPKDYQKITKHLILLKLKELNQWEGRSWIIELLGVSLLRVLLEILHTNHLG